jgi:hypothetical protein
MATLSSDVDHRRCTFRYKVRKEATTVNILDLPLEVLVYIMSKAEKGDWCSARQVCRQLRAAVTVAYDSARREAASDALLYHGDVTSAAYGYALKTLTRYLDNAVTYPVAMNAMIDGWNRRVGEGHLAPKWVDGTRAGGIVSGSSMKPIFVWASEEPVLWFMFGHRAPGDGTDMWCALSLEIGRLSDRDPKASMHIIQVTKSDPSTFEPVFSRKRGFSYSLSSKRDLMVEKKYVQDAYVRKGIPLPIRALKDELITIETYRAKDDLLDRCYTVIARRWERLQPIKGILDWAFKGITLDPVDGSYREVVAEWAGQTYIDTLRKSILPSKFARNGRRREIIPDCVNFV